MAIGSAIIGLVGTVIGVGAELYGQSEEDKARRAAGREAKAIDARNRRDTLRQSQISQGFNQQSLSLSKERLNLQKQAEKRQEKQWEEEFAHKKKYDRANHLLGVIQNNFAGKQAVTGLGFQRRK